MAAWELGHYLTLDHILERMQHEGDAFGLQFTSLDYLEPMSKQWWNSSAVFDFLYCSQFSEVTS